MAKKNKVAVEQYGVTHYYARCTQCGFDAGIQANGIETPDEVRHAARNHVMMTGHRVVIESCKTTDYYRREIHGTEKR